MNLSYEQLARRSLSSMCGSSVGPTFQIYSHATDPHRSPVNEVCVTEEVSTLTPPSSMNGVNNHSPSTSSRETPAPESPHSPASPQPALESHSPVSPQPAVDSSRSRSPPSQPHLPSSSPQSETQVGTPADSSIAHSPLKRKLDGDIESIPTPSKKRLKLSLSRSRSHTPSHHSLCSSRGNSPSSLASSGSTSTRPGSVSSTPPLSPINARPDSQTWRVKTPATPTSRHHQSTPLRTDTTLSESPLSTALEQQGYSKCLADVETSSPRPSTSQQVLSCVTTNLLDITPPLEEEDDNTLTYEDIDSRGELVKIEPPKASFHDISTWGEGRLVYGCDIPHSRPFDKFSQGHLENYAEMVSKGGDLENYLHTVERLVGLGWFFPTAKLEEVFRLMWRCHSEHAVKKIHFFLEQDIALRTDTRMKRSHFWHRLQKCLDSIKSNSNVLIASVQLSYLLKFFIKNLDDNKLEPNASLVEQLLSSKKTLNISNILDAIFSHQVRTVSPVIGVQCPVESLLTMLCLPLLTCDPSSRPELRTRLARDIAMRLNNLRPYSLQYQLITKIPSNYLKEKVLDFVLERNFVLSSTSTSVGKTFADNSVSFAKIASVHLHREPRHPNGSPHSLSFFLQLLTSLIQSHIVSVSGNQPLVSVVPSSPPQPLPDEFTTSSTMDDTQLRETLLDLHAGVLQLTERLSQDDRHFIELTEPSTWFHLQLLSLITSAL